MILMASGNSASSVACTVAPAGDPPGIMAVPSLVVPYGSWYVNGTSIVTSVNCRFRIQTGAPEQSPISKLLAVVTAFALAIVVWIRDLGRLDDLTQE
jgi:hypothetical protein